MNNPGPRLASRLAAMNAAEDSANKRQQISKHLADASDAFELAARCAEGAWNARDKAQHASARVREKDDVVDSALLNFELGYRVACAELAIILRAMRKGEPPSKNELAAAWTNMEKQIAAE